MMLFSSLRSRFPRRPPRPSATAGGGARRRPPASRCCCCAAPSAATTTAAPGSFRAACSIRRPRRDMLLRRPRRPAASAPARRRPGGLDYCSRRCANVSRSRACCSRPTRAAAGRPRRRPRRSAGRWRGALHRGERALGELCAEFGLRFAADRLTYLSHWLTPLGRAEALRHPLLPRRRAAAQIAAHDGTEMVEQRGSRPPRRWRKRAPEAADADAEHARNRLAVSLASTRCWSARDAARGRA